MTAGWVAVAKKDFRDAIRARSIWVSTALFVLFAVGATVVYAEFDVFHGGNPTAGGLIAFVRSAAGLFVPVMAVLAGYRSIAGERDDGSHRLLLSLPVSRREVLVGKLIGRTGVVVAPAFLSYVVAAAVAVALVGAFDVTQFVLFGAVTALYALSYVSVTVGISASTGSTSKALAGAVIAFAGFEFLWGNALLVGLIALEGFSPSAFDPVPVWYVVLGRVPPGGAFQAASTALTPGSSASSLAPQGFSGGGGFSLPSGSVLLEDWLGFLPLLFWVVAPAALGDRLLERADL